MNSNSADNGAVPGADALPAPDSSALDGLFNSEEVREAYAFLYSRRYSPPTMLEWREHSERVFGEAHSQSDRRLRDVRAHFDVRAEKTSGGEWVYRLVGRAPEGRVTRAKRRSISPRVEAEVYTRYGHRCAMCGATPKDDAVRLHMDHKIPLAWGGTNDAENLQPLCTAHNQGKQAHYASYDEHAAAIRVAIGLPTPWERIGELLKAFDGEWVPVELIEVVAREENAGDPTRRMRELRTPMGWKIDTTRAKEGKRTRSFYRVVHWEPWPPEGPRAAVNAYEAERKRRKRAGE